jgi:pyruvate dehydrogenase E1 component alpha subunit
MDQEILLEMYQTVLTIRRFEEAAIEQYRVGNIYGYLHPYIGEEAIAVGVITALKPDDYISSTHRGHGHAIAKGHDLKLIFAELMGKETGYCRGRGGSMHVANLEQNNLGANGIVGGGIPIAVGAAKAIKLRKSNQVVACFFSDGAVNNGVFHESINLAAIYDLPVIFVLENNQYASSTPVEKMNRNANLSEYAHAYGIPGQTVNGNDAVAVFEAANEFISIAREGKGPTLLECKTYRHSGHHVNDPGLYMPQEVLTEWKAKDPIILLEGKLKDAGVKPNLMQNIQQEVQEKIEGALEFAFESPSPNPDDFLAEIQAL